MADKDIDKHLIVVLQYSRFLKWTNKSLHCQDVFTKDIGNCRC